MTVLGKFQLSDLEESAKRTLRMAPEPWTSGHGSLTSGPKRMLIVSFILPTIDHYVKRCVPSVMLELIRGYRVYKYLMAQHADLVAECEMTIGPKP